MDIKPLHKKVLVAENKKQQTTTSGIILDGTRGTSDTARATVIAIGPQVADVKVGDVILLDWSKASVVKVGDAQRAMIDETNIIAIFEGN